MRISIYPITVLFFGLLLLAGCGSSGPTEDSPVIIRFKDNVLTQRMLDQYMPEGVSSEDSMRYADQFVKQWIKEQAIMDQALAADETLGERIEFKVQDYKAKLIMHEYHSALIADSLDTEVSDTEIRAYYDQHKDNFRSKENLYSYFYVVTTASSTNEPANWMRGEKPEDMEKLKTWAAENAMEYKLDSAFVGETTINLVSKGYFGNLQRAGIGKLIRWNGVISGERRRYLFKMLDIVKEGEALPLRLCREKIKNLIINDRKVKLIERTEKKIVRDARANNYVREY